MVIKYAGNMPKTFAAGAALVITSLMSIVLFDFHPALLFWLGIVVVVAAVLLFEARAMCAKMWAKLLPRASPRACNQPVAVAVSS